MKPAYLAARFQQVPLVGQKDFASIQVLQAAKPVGEPIGPDHPAVGNEQLAERDCVHDMPA
jgi:hypothetical protein